MPGRCAGCAFAFTWGDARVVEAAGLFMMDGKGSYSDTLEIVLLCSLRHVAALHSRLIESLTRPKVKLKVQQ